MTVLVEGWGDFLVGLLIDEEKGNRELSFVFDLRAFFVGTCENG